MHVATPAGRRCFADPHLYAAFYWNGRRRSKDSLLPVINDRDHEKGLCVTPPNPVTVAKGASEIGRSRVRLQKMTLFRWEAPLSMPRAQPWCTCRRIAEEKRGLAFHNLLPVISHVWLKNSPFTARLGTACPASRFVRLVRQVEADEHEITATTARLVISRCGGSISPYRALPSQMVAAYRRSLACSSGF